MYKILVVDDEKKEREGIEKLIKRYKLELEVTQACNGEEAFSLLEKQNFDILLTDIKMPFMNGIQLIEAVRKIGLNPICIIYSAYGEFEYAQNAISLGVQEYLLKPIRLDAFEELFKKTIGMCVEREEKATKKNEIEREYQEIVSFRQQKNLLSYLESEGPVVIEASEFEIDFSRQICVPILISPYSNLFVSDWESYRDIIRDVLEGPSNVINKGDNQILVLFLQNKEDYREKKLSENCRKILEISKKSYQTEIFMIIGKPAKGLTELKDRYEEIREQLDYQFFVTENTLLVHDKVYFIKKEQDMLPLYFDRVFNCAKLSDFKGLQKEFTKIFEYIENETGFSSIYVKYTFTDAIKRIYEYANINVGLIEYIQNIYEAKNFEELSQIICKAIENLSEKQDVKRNENRLVRTAKDIIFEKYQDYNLGVASIADELNVTTAYMSSLFKLETGQNLNKYITDYRLSKAKELLTQSNMKVSDIAAKVGYTNASYFISIFRNKEGTSPVQYREEIR